MIDRQTIEAAHDRIRPYIVRTPVLRSSQLNALSGAALFFKCENLQKIGAFKARGAMNAMLSLPPEALVRGVATHSSGNHAQALARAAHIMKVPAHIVMPSNAPAIKREGVLRYGAKLYPCAPTLAAREETLAGVVHSTGATEIHPFNNEAVIAGQATAAKELLEEIPDLDQLISPVGGGGLLSGSILAASFFSAGIPVFAAEPAGADDAFRSLRSGKIETSQAQSIADGLLTSLGDKTFAIIKDAVAGIITVEDAEIVQAMRLIWENLKVIAEPSAAVPLAAVLKQPALFRNKTTGIILSGGNIDLQKAYSLMQPASA